MIDILRDGIWQFFGVVLTILGIIATIWIYKKQRFSKILAYDVVDVSSLLNIHKSMENSLEISFQGHAVKNAYMISISFSNQGNTPIIRRDHDEPLTIKFANHGKVVGYGISARVPRDLNIESKLINDNSVEILPFLLNQKESFSIKSILINGDVDIDVRARIIGGKLILKHKTSSTLYGITSKDHLTFFIYLIFTFIYVFGGALSPVLDVIKFYINNY